MNSKTGLATNNDDEPVKPNTMKIIKICQLEFIPQRCFNLFMPQR